VPAVPSELLHPPNKAAPVSTTDKAKRRRVAAGAGDRSVVEILLRIMNGFLSKRRRRSDVTELAIPRRVNGID
jgi:hypothetical protein